MQKQMYQLLVKITIFCMVAGLLLTIGSGIVCKQIITSQSSQTGIAISIGSIVFGILLCVASLFACLFFQKRANAIGGETSEGSTEEAEIKVNQKTDV